MTEKYFETDNFTKCRSVYDYIIAELKWPYLSDLFDGRFSWQRDKLFNIKKFFSNQDLTDSQKDIIYKILNGKLLYIGSNELRSYCSYTYNKDFTCSQFIVLDDLRDKI